MEPFQGCTNTYSTPKPWAPITTVRSMIPRGSKLRESLDWGGDSCRCRARLVARKIRRSANTNLTRELWSLSIGFCVTIPRGSSPPANQNRGEQSNRYRTCVVDRILAALRPRKTYLSPRTRAPTTKIRIVATREAKLRAHLNWQATSYKGWGREISRRTKNLTLKPRPSPLRFVS